MTITRRLAVILIGATLLFACTAPSPDDDFVRGYLEAQSQYRLAQQAALSEALAASDARERAIATAYARHRCDDLNKYLNLDGDGGYLLGDSLEANFLIDGRCIDPDPARAIKLLQSTIASDPLASEAIARLAALYWHGQGVNQDRNKARALARRAGFIAGLDYVDTRLGVDQSIARGVDIDASFGVRLAALHFHFANTITGHWDLPPPLQAAQNWMMETYQAGGAGALSAGLNLSRGANGYPRDPALGFLWIELAHYGFDHGPATYPYAMALEDEAVQRALLALDGRPNGGEAVAAVLLRNRCLALSALALAADHDVRAKWELYRRYQAFVPADAEQARHRQRQLDIIIYRLHLEGAPIPAEEQERLAAYLARVESNDPHVHAIGLYDGLLGQDLCS